MGGEERKEKKKSIYIIIDFNATLLMRFLDEI
jgi:hypothetical protein